MVHLHYIVMRQNIRYNLLVNTVVIIEDENIGFLIINPYILVYILYIYN